jgi:hypothetical protein
MVDPGTKNPTYPGWPTRSLEADDFDQDNLVGIIAGPLSDGNRPGHALVIVDLDAMSAVEKADVYLPPTEMQEGRPGKPRSHRYYLVPLGTIPAEACSTAAQAAAAAIEQCGHPGPRTRPFNHPETRKRMIDFLGTGAQVVCPPSLWTSADGTRTERRAWDGGEPGEPSVVSYAELWGAVCRLAEACGWKPPKPAPRVAPAGANQDQDQDHHLVVRRRVLPYLARCAPAVSGDGGHAQTFAVARAVVYGFGLGADVGFQLLWYL